MYITFLPDEIIIIILERKEISIEDVMSFNCTCQRFQNIVSNCNKLWEKKYYQRCPTARKTYDTEKQKNLFCYVDFKKQIKINLIYIEDLQYYVSAISSNNFKQEEKKEIENRLRLIAEDSMAYYFVLDELNRISEEFQCQRDSNSTIGYFELLYYCLKNYRFTYKLIKFLKKPKEKQFFEKLPLILAQYFRPEISYSTIKTWLNDITQKILSGLPKKYLEHSSMSIEEFSFRIENNIYDNCRNPKEVNEIMPILAKFISDNESFVENELLEILEIKPDEDDRQFCCISPPLQNFLLTITFHSVARRLGIHCGLIINEINDNNDIKLLWNPNYDTEDFKYTEYFYMDYHSESIFYPNIVRGKCNDFEKYGPLKNNAILKLTQDMMEIFIDECENHYETYEIYCVWYYSLTFLKSYKVKEIEDINIETEYRNIINAINIKYFKLKEDYISEKRESEGE